MTAIALLSRGTVSYPDPKKGTMQSWMGASESGVNVNEDTALKLSAVYACVRLLSELPASLPLDIIEEKGDTRTPIDHPVKELLQRPNSYMNHFTWDEYTNALTQLWGNSISLIKRDFRMNISELIPVHTRYVQPVLVDSKPM